MGSGLMTLAVVMDGSLELRSWRGVLRGFRAGECLLWKGQRGVRGMFGRMRPFIARDLRQNSSKRKRGGTPKLASMPIFSRFQEEIICWRISFLLDGAWDDGKELYPLVLHCPILGSSTPLSNAGFVDSDRVVSG